LYMFCMKGDQEIMSSKAAKMSRISERTSHQSSKGIVCDQAL